ncbi:MAG: hypothetical protein IJC17_04775 [Clostridia bacterium]|nr:hypothetical protein [Clostridia bacterium]
MAKFCTKCGNPVEDGQVCLCTETPPMQGVKDRLSDILGKVANLIGLDLGSNHVLNPYERGQQIVPDNIRADEGEQPIKQYNLALLRSRILFKRAEGRLQVTNKRLIFRATGISLTGNTVLQHEFAIPEIAGVEIRKSNRFSFLSLFAAVIGSLIVCGAANSIFSSILTTSAFSSLVAYLIAFVSGASFFLFKKKFWLKLLLLSIGMSVMPVLTNSITLSAVMLGGEHIVKSLLTFPNLVASLLDILWILGVILVCMVPDLKVCIKTKSAGDAIQIRRKIWGFGLKQHDEFSGFSEVLPAADTDCAAKELGAMIDDLQTLGDMAIEKWKEN